jgi:hypothetical protein
MFSSEIWPSGRQEVIRIMTLTLGQPVLLVILFVGLGAAVSIILVYMVAIFTKRRRALKSGVPAAMTRELHPYAWRTRV